MDISNEIAARAITEVVHFTSNHGLVGSLEVGHVLSRRRLPEVKHLAHILAPTAKAREEAKDYFNKDADWLDFVNLSISEVNQHYFNVASTRWHTSGDRWWAILSFSPEILTHQNVWFTTTNNIYQYVKRGQGLAGFQELFSEKIRRKGNWYAERGSRPDNVATCQQAEVLYFGELSLEFLRRIYVSTEEQLDVVAGWLRLYKRNNVEVVLDADKFKGHPN